MSSVRRGEPCFPVECRNRNKFARHGGVNIRVVTRLNNSLVFFRRFNEQPPQHQIGSMLQRDICLFIKIDIDPRVSEIAFRLGQGRIRIKIVPDRY